MGNLGFPAHMAFSIWTKNLMLALYDESIFLHASYVAYGKLVMEIFMVFFLLFCLKVQICDMYAC